MDNNDVWFNFLEELKSRNDLVSVVSGYVNLKRSGNRYVARCPFPTHQDDTPSFSITPEIQRYYCFGCHEGGDVISFIQKMESLDFMGAVEFLANRSGLQIPHTRADKDLQAKKKRRQDMAQICREAARYYHGVLVSPAGKASMQYLAERGISQSTVTRFGLGLSPSWDGLRDHLRSKGLDLELAYECGVLEKRDKGRYSDALGERLIIPIINSMGDVIAFGGRRMKEGVFAKYKNTKQTELFDKSKNLFAINLVAKTKKKTGLDDMIVVEGYMDAIALHQAGLTGAVASMGTALTKEQARLIKRYVEKVYICYDGDAAGEKGTLRGLDILKQEGLEVRVMSMPDGVDPDEVILKFGVEAYEKLKQDALPLTDYKLNAAKKGLDLDSKNAAEREDAKRKYIAAAFEIIGELSSPIEQESYLMKIARETGFDLQWLKTTLAARKIKTDEFAVSPLPKGGFAPDRVQKAWFFILACLLADEEYAVFDFETMPDDEFLSTCFKYVRDCREKGKKPVAGMLGELFDGKYNDRLDYLSQTVFSTTLENKNYFNDCVRLVKKSKADDEISALNNAYANETDEAKRAEIAKKLAELIKKI